MAAKEYMGYRQLAEYTGISEPVLRRYLSAARSNRAEGTTTKSDLPEPDLVVGSSPAWEPKTIDKWLHARPGKGVGGGPKPKSKTKG